MDLPLPLPLTVSLPSESSSLLLPSEILPPLYLRLPSGFLLPLRPPSSSLLLLSTGEGWPSCSPASAPAGSSHSTSRTWGFPGLG